MARYFGGTADAWYYELGSSDFPKIDEPSDAITLAAWAQYNGNFGGGNNHGLIVKAESANFFSYSLSYNGGTYGSKTWVQVGGTLYSAAYGSFLGQDVWHLHIGRWSTGNTVRNTIYDADGNLVANNASASSPTGTIDYDTGALRFGTESPTAQHLPGTLARCTVWPEDLSDEQVLAWMLHGREIGSVPSVWAEEPDLDLMGGVPTEVGPPTLAENGPWQPHGLLFPRRRLFVVPAGGGSTTLVVPLLGSSSTLYAPTVDPGSVDLTAPHIASGASLQPPTLEPGAVDLDLPALASSAALYGPTLDPGPVDLTAPHIASGAALYTPTLEIGAVDLTVPHVASGEALYSPTLDAGPVTLTAPAIASGSQLYAPALDVGESTLVVPLLGASSTLYAPTLEAAGDLGVPYLASGIQLYAPTLAYPQDLELPLVASSSVLFAPSLADPVSHHKAPVPTSLDTIEDAIAAKLATVTPRYTRAQTDTWKRYFQERDPSITARWYRLEWLPEGEGSWISHHMAESVALLGIITDYGGIPLHKLPMILEDDWQQLRDKLNDLKRPADANYVNGLRRVEFVDQVTVVDNRGNQDQVEHQFRISYLKARS